MLCILDGSLNLRALPSIFLLVVRVLGPSIIVIGRDQLCHVVDHGLKVNLDESCSGGGCDGGY